MVEENIPDEYRPKEKKEKLVSKKRWMEMVGELAEINPEMNPNEAFRRIKQVDMTVNPHISEEMRERWRKVKELQEEQLKRNGVENPKEWVAYTSSQPEGYGSGNLDQPFTEDDMRRLSRNLPQGMELFVVQGQISPGSELDKGANPYNLIDHFWSAFVKLKSPTELKENPRLIESYETKT